MFLIGVVTVITVVMFILIIFATGYVKASPDEAILISGYRPQFRVVIGKAAIKIPFLERADKLSLRIIKIDVKTRESVPTNEFINVNVDAVVTVKISSDPELMKLAAQNFLNQPLEYVESIVKDVLEGNIREIVGKMTLENMMSNRQAFSSNVQENAVPDMRNMGIEIVSFNVQNFSDENGVINDMGIDNTTKIKMNAAIVKAQSERDIAIEQAKADKEANDARVESNLEIARRNTELQISKAELKKQQDTKQAEADAAYEIQKEEQRKTIEVAKAEADLARQEKEIQIQTKAVEVREQQLQAEVNKRADADKYAKEKQAEADLIVRQKEADAKKYEAERAAAALEARAKAERVAKEEEAIGLKAVLLAEAEGIREKGLAEAESLDKKAEALKKMDKAAIAEMYFKVLPEVVKNVAAPLSNVDSITMYGDGNSAKMVGDITKSVDQISAGIGDALGIDMKSVLSGFLGGKAAGNSLKEDANELIEEIKSELNK